MRACGLERRLFCVVVVASWWITSASIIVFADEPASNATNAASEATSVLQEPDAASPSPKAKWQFNGFVDAGYLLDFNHPANHLFRDRSTAFKVNELDLNMAQAGVKKLASENSRWGMELAVQAGKDSENFGFSPTAPNVSGSDWLRHFALADASYLAPVGKGLTLQAGLLNSLIGYGRWTGSVQLVKAVAGALEYKLSYRKTTTIARLEYRFDDSRGKGGGFFRGAEVSPGVIALTPTQHLLILGLIFGVDSQ